MKYLLTTIYEVFTSYFKGQGIVILILCALYATALGLIGVKFGILIGILTGLLSVIPYLGFMSGLVVSVIVAAIQFRSVLPVLWVLLAFAVIQVLESFVITPKILGKSIGINPIATLVLLIIGGMAAGPVGMIIAIPVAGVLFKIYRDKLKKTEDENILN